MDYEKTLAELNNASLFELYRLDQAIWKQLEDPDIFWLKVLPAAIAVADKI
ncbi:MAG: hypothetical protein HQL46_12740 [Gammaproteobacteria bacterium]|nr:hypothetical protein [Gammaproteobacteria bacterium]